MRRFQEGYDEFVNALKIFTICFPSNHSSVKRAEAELANAKRALAYRNK